MPGVPSYKGCDACRKQKKKCDKAQPRCARCERLDIPCVNVGKQRYKFKIQTLNRESSSSSTPQIVDTDGETSSSSASRKSVSPFLFQQALIKVPSNKTTVVTHTLVSRLEITDLRYDITCYGDFLRHIPARLGRNEALDASADALATTFSTLHMPQGYQTIDALTKYGRAINSLRLCLDNPAKARMPETMCAVYLIMICQGWLGRDDDPCTSHGQGLAYLLKAAARENWKAGFETDMVLTFCVPVIIESISNPKVKLEKWFWDMLDNFKKNNPPSTAETRQAKQEGQDSGGIPSLSIRNLGRLPDFINNPETHRMEITCAYHRLCRDLRKVAEIVRAVTWEPGYSPTPMQLRLSRSYNSAYSVLLTVLVIMNCLMQAFDPYNLALVGEAALCSSEVVSMARNISQYRPLGASHVPLALAIAWAATEEEGLKTQLYDLLKEYQQDWMVTRWDKVGYWWMDKFGELRERLAPRVISPDDDDILIFERMGFAEVGIKLTKTAQRAYKSTSGLIQEDEEFLTDTERLKKLVGLIDQGQSNPEDARQAGIDENLRQTAKACDEYASQLETLLGFLRRRPGELRALEALRTAMLRRLRNTEIQALEGKLINVQIKLLLALTTSSHSRQSSALVAIRELKQQNAVLEASTTSKLESIESLIRGIDLKEEGTSNAAKMVISHLDNLVVEAQRVKKHHDFLKSLRFREIKQRHSAIQDHHKATFKWVFAKGQTGFREWLEDGSGFFWVKGKAGSGKSTLMKFIATHDDTQSLLRTWGGERRVITASHFFWNAGLPMQKSLTGLFQTILYQVLRECPELIDTIDSPRQESSAESSLCDSWDDKTLFRAFEQLSSQKSLPLRFCFFIDGLDEYTAGAHRYTGTFEELLSPLRSRLNELPDDLQRYFEHMLQSIETIYWDSTTRIFRTVIAAEQSLPLLAFELLDREMDDPDYALTMQASPLTDVESEAICKRSNTRLNARCGDLLYVTVNPAEPELFKSQVDFLHRTVRDFFLDTGVIDDMIQKRPTEKFDPHLSLCRIMLGLNKVITPGENSSQVYNQLYIIVDGLMHYARSVEETFTRLEEDEMAEHDTTSLEQVFKILDELDRTNCEGLNHLGVHWTNIKDPPQGTFREGRNKTFLAATIQARLALYTADRLKKNPAEIRQKGGRPLLDYALRPTMVTPLQIIHLEQGPVLPIVELLLDLGADPNAGIYIYENRTPWELFLEMCHQHTKQEIKPEHLLDDIGRAMELMVQGGARTDGLFQVSYGLSLKLMVIAGRLGLPQHCMNKIEEVVENKEQGRSFLSRMFMWN
ncbi:hypothetical protein HYE68_007640 [Fusarium pseudograminearum]|nr:hypothetical protein HYE68_007640 [Fusarium pseudograminearum]